MSDNKSFPIQGEYQQYERGSIPWWLAEIAYEHYSKLFGNQQSLQTLADRGGFGRREFVAYIRKERP